MKVFLSIILSLLLAYASGLYLPWWGIILSTFIVSIVIVQRPLPAFLCGFISLFLLWLFMAVYIDSANGGTLAPKISQIMGFGKSSSMLMLVTSIVGGLSGGMGALTGSLLMRVKGER